MQMGNPNLRISVASAALVAYVTVTLCPPSLSFASSDRVVNPKQRPEINQEIALPANLGKIQDVYVPSSGQSAPLIFHIQTAHGHYESALKVEEIIHYLEDRYGIKVLFSEGAVNRLEPNLLRFFPQPKLNRELADELARKGELTGVDLSLLPRIDKPSTVFPEAFGIEDPILYRQAYQSFKETIERHHTLQAYLDQKKNHLAQRAAKIFSPPLQRLINRLQTFHSDKHDLLALARFLKKDARQTLNLDLTQPLAQFEWPQLTRLLAMQQLEKLRNHQILNQEQRSLKEWLRSKNLPNSIVSHFSLYSQPLSRSLYENFYRKTHGLGFQFSHYPQMAYAASFNILHREINAPLLDNELTRLFDRLLEEHAKTTQEKLLTQEYRKFHLLNKFSRLEMTPEEWQKIKKDKTLEKEPRWQSARQFYFFAEKREQAFLKRIQRILQNRKTERAILVTGGFHTEGMSRLLRKAGIGYVQIIPAIHEIGTSNFYQQIMLRTFHLEKPNFPERAVDIAALLGPYSKRYLDSELQSVQQALVHKAKTHPTLFSQGQNTPYVRDRKTFLDDSAPTDRLLEKVLRASSRRSEIRTEYDELSLEEKTRRLILYVGDIAGQLRYFIPRQTPEFKIISDLESGWEAERIRQFYTWDQQKSFYRPFYFFSLTLQPKKKWFDLVKDVLNQTLVLLNLQQFSNRLGGVSRIPLTYHFLFYTENGLNLNLQIFRIQPREMPTPLDILAKLSHLLRIETLQKFRAIPVSLNQFLAHVPVVSEPAFREIIYTYSSPFPSDSESDKYKSGLSFETIYQTEKAQSQLRIVVMDSYQDILDQLHYQLGSTHVKYPVSAVIHLGEDDPTQAGNESNWASEVLRQRLAYYFIHLSSSGKDLPLQIFKWGENRPAERIHNPNEISSELELLQMNSDQRIFIAIDAEVFQKDAPQALDSITDRLLEFLSRHAPFQPQVYLYLVVPRNSHLHGKYQHILNPLRDKLSQWINQSEFPRSELRQTQAPVKLTLPPQNHNAYPIRFSTSYLGIYHRFYGVEWSPKAIIRYHNLLKNYYGRANRKQIRLESKALQDPSKDGLFILHKRLRKNPIILQVDLKSLNHKDRSYLKVRLRNLPKGSLLIAYADTAMKSSEDILTPLMKDLPSDDLYYSRISYVKTIKLADIKREIERAKKLGIDQENAAFLISDRKLIAEGDVLEASKIKNLGLMFQFDPKRLSPKYQSLRGLSAAALGEVSKAAELDRELQATYLKQGLSEGLFADQNGIYSLEETWSEARLAAELLSSAA